MRGLRLEKGTSGDQPNLRAGLAFGGRTDLVTRYQHSHDELLEWQPREVEGHSRICLVYRDGANDVFAAREAVSVAFKGQSFTREGERRRIESVDFDLMENLFWVVGDDGKRAALDILAFLLEDEEVNARYQRNKGKVSQAMVGPDCS